MKRLNIGDFFWISGIYYKVVDTKNSIAAVVDNFGKIKYVNRADHAGLRWGKIDWLAGAA